MQPQSVRDILNHTFGYKEFRERQLEIIEAVVQGKNTLVVMPTGGGKSLCYQIPALARAGMGVVISPLIALMQDQVSALQKQGVNAGFLNSSLDYRETLAIESAISEQRLELLYIAPERLNQERTLQLLLQAPLSLIAIDEAHCVAQWGHDFRVDYLRLNLLVEHFPNIPRIALTATADKRTRKEIQRHLQLDKDANFICGFDRPNIQYRISQKNKPKQQLLDFIRNEHPDSAGIIYCLARKRVEEIALYLSEHDIPALPYHAGMPAETRKANQDRFLRDEHCVVVATIAFGMGIDKPNVRFVAHLDMPKSIESYYQETGRAGRDGLAADAILFYGMEDVVKLSQMAAQSQGDENFKRHEQQRLNSMLGLCELTTCRRQALLHYFGEELGEACGNCDNCLLPPSTWDASEAVQKALSCVYRTGQRFGAAHVIDVLRGGDTERIRRFGHNTLSTWGIGQDLNAETWRSVFRQLIVMGFLRIDHEGYGSLLLTERCRPLLRGAEQIQLRKDQRAGTSTRKIPAHTTFDIEEEDRPLWQALRQCRTRLAQEQNVPPYIIFSDATLKEMIIRKPVNNNEFIDINGVGDKKLEQYGAEFMAVIQEFEYA